MGIAHRATDAEVIQSKRPVIQIRVLLSGWRVFSMFEANEKAQGLIQGLLHDYPATTRTWLTRGLLQG